jgi:hypothetical protein
VARINLKRIKIGQGWEPGEGTDEDCWVDTVSEQRNLLPVKFFMELCSRIEFSEMSIQKSIQ